MLGDNQNNKLGFLNGSATPIGVMEPPAIPTGLRATGGDNQVHLAWEAVADTDLAGYHVERTSPAALRTGPASPAAR